jgi:hypothetical protein
MPMALALLFPYKAKITEKQIEPSLLDRLAWGSDGFRSLTMFIKQRVKGDVHG